MEEKQESTQLVTCGLVYRLRFEERQGGAFPSSCAVTFSYACVEHSTLTADSCVLRVPVEWKFKLPPVDGFAREGFGASETKGLFYGGIEDPRCAKISEGTERAVGDTLTVALCEILAKCFASGTRIDRAHLLVLGPALPKVVGRFAALKPDRRIDIFWLCPIPAPPWMAEGAASRLAVPRYLSVRDRSEEIWEDESLIEGWQWSRGTHNYAVQRLRLWEMRPSQVGASHMVWDRIANEFKDWQGARNLYKGIKPAAGNTKLPELPEEVRLPAQAIERVMRNEIKPKGGKESQYHPSGYGKFGTFQLEAYGAARSPAEEWWQLFRAGDGGRERKAGTADVGPRS